MKAKTLFVAIFIFIMVLSGCSGQENHSNIDDNETQEDIQISETQNNEALDNEASDTDSQTSEALGMTVPTEIVVSDMFSDRDRDTYYDESRGVLIELSGNSASCESASVDISGSTVTITDEGTYIISGSLDDGMVVVNADKKDKLQLVLKDASINCDTSAPIYVLQADKVFITLAEDSENTLSNGGTFISIDENNIDAVVYSKEDLTINGAGSLTVTSPSGHGIVSKDDLVLIGGSYEINTAAQGISGKDSVRIADTELNITSGKDGIHSENTDDISLGFVYIEGGVFNISAEGDALSASANMQIDGGSFNIITGGGSVNAEQHSSDSWGDFMGGPGGPMGQPGQPGHPGGMGRSADDSQENTLNDVSEDDSTSIKALKASGNLVINGGEFIIDAADDAVHGNADVTINGGVFEISTGDDGFHADESLRIIAGVINIAESYEGLEGLDIEIYGGDIKLVASDDGLNAAGGNDESGFGGPRGQDMFAANEDSFINISGGTLYVNAEGDGIDSNGSLDVSGGYTIVAGPTNGGNGPLDYAGSGSISGGTFIATGSVQMAQTITSTANQGVIAVSTGSQEAGTVVRITDTNGSDILLVEPEKTFQCVVASCPDMVKGADYTIWVGELSAEFTAS